MDIIISLLIGAAVGLHVRELITAYILNQTGKWSGQQSVLNKRVTILMSAHGLAPYITTLWLMMCTALYGLYGIIVFLVTIYIALRFTFQKVWPEEE